MTDLEVAARIHQHYFKRPMACDKLVHPAGGKCTCDYAERVRNTFLILRTIRVAERAECEAIARTSGGARAADMIRDRVKDDDKR